MLDEQTVSRAHDRPMEVMLRAAQAVEEEILNQPRQVPGILGLREPVLERSKVGIPNDHIEADMPVGHLIHRAAKQGEGTIGFEPHENAACIRARSKRASSGLETGYAANAEQFLLIFTNHMKAAAVL